MHSLQHFWRVLLCFLVNIVHLRDGGCKMVLLYDEYRSHLSFPVLYIFYKRNIISYAVFSHTLAAPRNHSWRWCIWTLNTYFRNSLDSAVSTPHVLTTVFDKFFIAWATTSAYRKSITKKTIISAFYSVEICQLDEIRLFGHAWQSFFADLHLLISVD